MRDRPEGEQAPERRSAGQDEDTLAGHTAAADQADQDLAKQARRAKRRRTTRKAIEVSGHAAAVVAEGAANFAEVISSHLP